MRLATLAIAIFSLVASDHIIHPQPALGKFAAAASPHPYVSNFGSNTVKVIATVVAEVPLDPPPIGVAINPDGAFVYVTIARSVGPGMPVAVSITPVA